MYRDLAPSDNGARIQFSPFPAYTPIAMSYVPVQKFTDLYEPEKAFEAGTLFMELDKPFLGSKRGACR